MSIDAMKQALEYTQPGAIVPVTPETVKILVDALRLAIEQAEEHTFLQCPRTGGECTHADNCASGCKDSGAAPPQRLPDYVWCGCGDGIMPNTGAKCGTCASIDAAPPQRQPLTEVAEALRRHGLTLVETAKGYDVMKLGQITAHGIGGEHD